MKTNIKTCAFLVLIVSISFSCSGTRAKEELVEQYTPATRQLPLEPVYSRVTWSHLPKPVGPKFGGKSPYLEKVYSFEMSSSSLGESLSALSQAMGYEAVYPKKLANKKVSLVTEGTVYQILDKICQQAGVEAEVDHKSRVIRVLGDDTKPKL